MGNMDNRDKHGYWMWADGYVGTTAVCSVCKLSANRGYIMPKEMIGKLPRHEYCSHCGAKMDAKNPDESTNESEIVCCKLPGYRHCEFDGVLFCKNPDCVTPVVTSTLEYAHPSGCPKIDKWNSKSAEEKENG